MSPTVFFCRYCNYADTCRDLDPRRMVSAYAYSTLAACGIGLGALVAMRRFPTLHSIGVGVPHAAVGCAGAISTLMNNVRDLQSGVPVMDGDGGMYGTSCAAALTGVFRATLLQAGVSHTFLICPRGHTPILPIYHRMYLLLS